MADTPYILKRLNNRKIAPVEPSTGAYYYVFTKDLNLSTTYLSASTIIELPERVNVLGTDKKKRVAYISLGIRGTWTDGKYSYADGIDLGIGSEDGKTWHPAYYDATNGMGHNTDPHSADYLGFTTTGTTKKVKLTVAPVSGTSVSMTVAYLNASGVELKSKKFIIEAIPTNRTWNQYYRFGSLVPTTKGQDNRSDSTYIVAGKFTQSRLNKSSGYITWGIEPQNENNPVELAFTYGHPKCQVITINLDGEVFNIDHWA